MDKISELKGILGGFLFWNKARLDCFSRMLVGLFRVKTVNLREIAVGFVSEADVDSRYKRVKRFFSQFEMDVELIARWICKLFFPAEKKFYLTIDRTNWFFGKAKINILVIAMAYEGIAIPLFWKFLDKAGNASAKEHVEILQRFIKNLVKDCILGVLGDREFGSKTFFSWLNKKKIHFYVRIKEDTQMRIGKRKIGKAKKFFNDLKPKTVECYPYLPKEMGNRKLISRIKKSRFSF